MDAAGARGEGLEPSITGPEPVVLPITPPPNGWTFRLAERPGGSNSAVRPGRPRCIGSGTVEDRRPGRSGVLGNEPDSEVLGMQRWTVGAPPWLGCWALPCSPRRPKPAPQHGRQGVPAKASRPVRWSPSAGMACRRPPATAPDLVPGRVHGCRPGPDRPLDRHAPLRHHPRPGHQGPNGHLHRPLPADDRDHRRRLTAARRASDLRHRRRHRPGHGHRREHQLQERHPGDAGSTSHRPPADRRLLTATRLRRRAATPGGCSR